MDDMPKRSPCDGPVGVDRMVETMPPHGEAGFVIVATHNGERQSMRVSRYNAARILCLLCLLLEVPHPNALGKLPM